MLRPTHRRLATLLIAVATLPGCYLARSGLHHNDLFNSRRRVEDVLSDPAVDEDTRERLRYVATVLAFAEKSGLNTDGAYQYYIRTDQPVVSYIVQAAYADRLEFATWWFPVVGRVPYLGYFLEEERDTKARELEAEGLDVERGAAGAFSSLGWLRRSDLQLDAYAQRGRRRAFVFPRADASHALDPGRRRFQ